MLHEYKTFEALGTRQSVCKTINSVSIDLASHELIGDTIISKQFKKHESKTHEKRTEIREHQRNLEIKYEPQASVLQRFV